VGLGLAVTILAISERRSVIVVALAFAALFWRGFDDALRGHSWNDSRKSVISGIKQDAKLSFRTFPPSRHDHHVQIKKFAE